jgi:hypothetical protein
MTRATMHTEIESEEKKDVPTQSYKPCYVKIKYE